MKLLRILLLLTLCGAASIAFAQPGVVVECVNPLGVERTDEVVSFPARGFAKETIRFLDGATVVPHQVVNGRILLVLSFGPRETKRLTVDESGIPAFPKRTQADLAVKVDYQLVGGVYTGGRYQRVLSARIPPGHIPHDAYFKYEGPGWESDLVGYRLYLDERNRCDIFGKRARGVVLHTVGVNDLVSDGKESYQQMQEWGQDIFKVGASLGIGSFALWHGGRPIPVAVIDSGICRVTEDGPVYSEVSLDYYGWKAGGRSRTLNAKLSIAAGSRLTHVTLAGRPAGARFCTGLARHDGCTLLRSPRRAGWGYIATYGKQALMGDNLGIALFYRVADCVRRTEDSLSQILVLQPRGGRVEYAFAAAWEQEPDGIRDAEAFRRYLDSTARSLGAPIRAVVRKLK
jgi:Domain of unknown function (DUF4861)